MKTATEIAMWFIQKHPDLKTQSKEGAVKLQKLLFFTWLIHFSKYGESLFDDDFFAFERGPVVDTVRQKYNSNFQQFLERDINYSDEETVSLNLSSDIFGNSTAKELEEISHRSPMWNKYYKKSLVGSSCGEFKDKHLSKIPKSELDEELDMIETVMYVHENMLVEGSN